MADLDMEQLAAAALKHAKRVALAMWRDPEAESLAGASAWLALRTFDPSRGVPLRRWIARQVRRNVWYEWRKRAKRREEQKDTMWWEAAATFTPEPDYELSPYAVKLLTERFVDKLPLDVLARRYYCTVKVLRRMLATAVRLLEESVR